MNFHAFTTRLFNRYNIIYNNNNNNNENDIYLDLSLALLSQILATVSISLIDLSAKFSDECIASKTKQS